MAHQGATTHKSIFTVPKMDCASEERIIRMALDGDPAVLSVSFDLEGRKLTAVHTSSPEAVLAKLEPLRLGAAIAQTTREDSHQEDADGASAPDREGEASLLRQLAWINAAMFVVELVVGIAGQSTGLIADSLDMFADAAVLGLSLFAVGRSAAAKTRAAHVAGWLQLVLALGALSEVVRRFLYGSEPASVLMIVMGAFALAANAWCLRAMAKRRNDGAHMKAGYIFLSNDVLANAGVIVAGVLVAVTGSPFPDLVIGTIVGLVVLNGARRILAL